jgi:hypothetical protein
MAILTDRPAEYDATAWLREKRCHVLTYAQCGLAIAQHHACLIGGVDYLTFERSLQNIHEKREAGTFWPAVNLTVTPVVFCEEPLRIEADKFVFRLPEWSFGVESGVSHGAISGCRTSEWTQNEIAKVVRDCIEANEVHVKAQVIECCLCGLFYRLLIEEYGMVERPHAKVIFWTLP